MVLDWGNVLKFDNEKDYYETLGFLSKEIGRASCRERV